MSENWLIIVPIDPFAAPDAKAVVAARQVLEQGLPDAEEVTVQVGTNPQFIDAGGNFESVTCSACAADLEAWWPQAMHRAHESGFRDLSVETPCCRTVTTLNDLDYEWAQAFARLSIRAMNPNVKDLAPALKDDVERHLGTPTRIIWQHI